MSSANPVGDHWGSKVTTHALKMLQNHFWRNLSEFFLIFQQFLWIFEFFFSKNFPAAAVTQYLCVWRASKSTKNTKKIAWHNTEKLHNKIALALAVCGQTFFCLLCVDVCGPHTHAPRPTNTTIPRVFLVFWVFVVGPRPIVCASRFPPPPSHYTHARIPTNAKIHFWVFPVCDAHLWSKSICSAAVGWGWVWGCDYMHFLGGPAHWNVLLGSVSDAFGCVRACNLCRSVGWLTIEENFRFF